MVVQLQALFAGYALCDVLLEELHDLQGYGGEMSLVVYLCMGNLIVRGRACFSDRIGVMSMAGRCASAWAWLAAFSWPWCVCSGHVGSLRGYRVALEGEVLVVTLTLPLTLTLTLIGYRVALEFEVLVAAVDQALLDYFV